MSIVLVTYNRGARLPATIDSILRQTYTAFELIICDDCSTDTTSGVCADYVARDRRVTTLRQSANVGMPENLNSGLVRSRGKYIAILHDGDMYEPTLIEKWRDALDRAPNAGFVFNAYRIIDGTGTTIAIRRENLPAVCEPPTLLERTYLRRWRFDCPTWGTVMGRAEMFEELGLFDPRFGFFADVDMWLRAAESWPIAYVPEPLIGLPTRDSLPRAAQAHRRADEVTTRAIYKEAFHRHYQGHKLYVLHIARFWGYVIAGQSYKTLARYLGVTRRWLRSQGRAIRWSSSK